MSKRATLDDKLRDLEAETVHTLVVDRVPTGPGVRVPMSKENPTVRCPRCGRITQADMLVMTPERATPYPCVCDACVWLLEKTGGLD